MTLTKCNSDWQLRDKRKKKTGTISSAESVIHMQTSVKSITFYDSWNEIILLEVLTENIEFV